MTSFGNALNCVPLADRRFSATGFCASYFASIQALASAQPSSQDRLIVLGQLLPRLDVGEQMQRRAAFPPARVVVELGDLVEAELLVVVRTHPFGGVDRAFFQRRIDLAAGDLLRHDAELRQHLARESADAQLEALRDRRWT